MGEFFKRMWEIEKEKLTFAIDYWYIPVTIIIGVVAITVLSELHKRNKRKRQTISTK